MEIPDRYDPKTAEVKWQKFWEENGTYKFDVKSKKEVYAVDTPPPTMSGKMHLGHAFSYSQQDFVVRYHRMLGKNVLYPFGTDDNGLPTEKLVEKEKAVKASKMKRKDFQKLCLDYLKEHTKAFVQDWKNIGMSCDWSVYYSTINEHCQKVSQKAFIDLFKDGRQFRKEAPVMWCPQCQTAIAQAELEDVEKPSTFNDLAFTGPDGKQLIIATTRPEMLAACVAIFAHPEDKRYKKFIGKTAKVPLYNHEVPILADESVDQEKGTGIVMCCTFGDKHDAEWYKAYNLPLKIALGKDGKTTALAGEFKDLTVADARKAVIEKLKEQKLLLNQKQITHAVNVHERCQTPIEILESPQWYVKYLDLKDDFLHAGRELNWYPEHMRARYENWVKGLQWDWCISRQRFFGIPFPVWYCKKCKEVNVADESQLPVDPLEDQPKKPCKCGSKEFIGESDVMDTWATSSVTPKIVSQLFDEATIKKVYPMSLRPQAHDIIGTWLFYTIVKSRLLDKTNPWKDAVISGHVLDPKGQKMSKSKGNVIRPQEVIEKYPADAFRFWAAGSKLGEDLPYQEKDLVTGVKTINKLWNATKFAFMQLDDFKPGKAPKLEETDKWLLYRLNKLVKECTESFEKYEYSRTKADTENFFFNTLCDNYIEIIKDRVYNPDKRGKEARLSAQYTTYTALLTVIKLFAPIMPHITEELYQTFFKQYEKESSIHANTWPKVDEKYLEYDNVAVGDTLLYAVEAARKAKSERKVSLKTPIKCFDLKAKIMESQFKLIELDLKAAINAEKVTFVELKKESKIDFEHDILIE